MIPKKIYIPTNLIDFPKGRAVVRNVQVCNEQRDFCSEYVNLLDVWHSRYDKPEDGKNLLVFSHVYGYQRIKHYVEAEHVVKGRQMNGWKLIRYQLKIDLWAYEEDLIPMNFTEFPLPQEL